MANKYTPNENYDDITSLRKYYRIVKENIAKIFNVFCGHISGDTDRHRAIDVDYDDAQTVKEKIDNNKADFDNKISDEARIRKEEDEKLKTAIDVETSERKIAIANEAADRKLTDELLEKEIKKKTPFEDVWQEDFNDCTYVGFYGGRFIKNTPTKEASYWSLIVPNSGAADYYHQIAIKESTKDMYIRYCDNSVWSDWVELPTMIDVNLKADKVTKGGFAAGNYGNIVGEGNIVLGDGVDALGDLGIVMGSGSIASDKGVVLGIDSSALEESISEGYEAICQAKKSVQFGTGINKKDYTMQFRNYRIVDFDPVDSEYWLWDVGRLSRLNTKDKNTIVDAVNSVVSLIGDLSSLPEYAGEDLCEVMRWIINFMGNNQQYIDDLAESIGDIKELETDNKSSVVNAINEINKSTSKLGRFVEKGAYDEDEAFTLAVGRGSEAERQSLALGVGAKALARHSTQIGYGENYSPDTVRIKDYELMRHAPYDETKDIEEHDYLTDVGNLYDLDIGYHRDIVDAINTLNKKIGTGGGSTENRLAMLEVLAMQLSPPEGMSLAYVKIDELDETAAMFSAAQSGTVEERLAALEGFFANIAAPDGMGAAYVNQE